MAIIKKYFPAMRVNISVPHLNEFGNKIVTNITVDNGIEVSKVDSNESFKKEVAVLKQAGIIKMREVEIADKAPKAAPKFGSVSKKEVKKEVKVEEVKSVPKSTNTTAGAVKAKSVAKPKVEDEKKS